MNPVNYISTSNGMFRVIVNGCPVCADKKTLSEVMAVVAQMKIKLCGDTMFNGDIGDFVPVNPVAPVAIVAPVVDITIKRVINAQTIINEVMQAHAVAPDEASAFITFKTSEKGTHRIHDCKANLQRFADMVRKNHVAFGGGLIRAVKAKPSVSWDAKLISVFKQSIECSDFQAAFDVGAKLGALFFKSRQGEAFMQVAPVPFELDTRLVSVLNQDGKYSVIEPVSMCSVDGSSYVQKKSRAGQVDNVAFRFKTFSSDSVENMILKAHQPPTDQDALRAQWLTEHGLTSEATETRIAAHEIEISEAIADPEIVETVSLGDRFEAELAKRKEAREALAAQDVAQVVANAVAAVAISEAMQPSETRELETCQAGDSEEQSTGSANYEQNQAVSHATYAPIAINSIAKQAFSGENVAKNPEFSGDFEENGDSEKPSTPSVVESGAVATPTVAVSMNFSGDIPLSLAVSAYNGVSMSPERRGASAQKEYGQTMMADYETMKVQATKGGTLDLLPEVFARYNARQGSAYRAYLSSSSRCVSSFIAGPSNFPAARMNKRSEIAHKRLGEYLNGGEMALRAACRTLRPDLRAIMAGDADAIDRLTVKISNAERLQKMMKDVNKAIRANAKKGEAAQVSALMDIGVSESNAANLLHPQFAYQGQGFPSYSMTNNNANIRRMKERLEQISKAHDCEVVAVKCSNGVTLEDDAPANRVRLFFPGKPSEEIRADLKSSGFRWAPSVGAWQAYRNHGTLATARRLAGEPIQAKESTQDAAPEAEVVSVVEIEAMAPSVESTETPAPTVTEFLPEDTRISYSKIKRGTAFTFEINGPVFVKSVNGYRPGRGGEKIAVYSGMLVHPFSLDAAPTPPATKPEAQQVQDVPAVNLPEAPEVTHSHESAPKGQQVLSKSGKWFAVFRVMPSGLFAMFFSSSANYWSASSYATAIDRMKALQAMAKAADAPTDTPPTGGLPCPVKTPVAHALAAALIPVLNLTPTPPVAQSAPCTPVTVSSASDDHAIQIGHKVIKGHNVVWLNDGRVHIGRELFDLLAVDSESFDWVAKTPREFDAICAIIAKPSAGDAPRYTRNVVPENGLHIVDDAFEAWTFTSGDRFAFVMYLGKSAKPWKYFGYPTEAKRDDGFERHATDARAISMSKANQKLASKAQAGKPHGLQVGDVVRSSWGYDQTNVNHYQIVSVIGKRTVEVRELAEHEESTGDMSGRVAPVHGDFVGEAKRCTVDKLGQVNVRGADYGRASKIEPVAVVHGVRCYAASHYSTYA